MDRGDKVFGGIGISGDLGGGAGVVGTSNSIEIEIRGDRDTTCLYLLQGPINAVSRGSSVLVGGYRA